MRLEIGGTTGPFKLIQKVLLNYMKTVVDDLQNCDASSDADDVRVTAQPPFGDYN